MRPLLKGDICARRGQTARKRSPMSAPKKHPTDVPPRGQTAFANNPFAKLDRDSVAPAKPPSVAPAPVASRPRPKTSLASRLVVRHEAVGRSGKVVTRISGVPAEARDTVVAKLGKALGCVATL